MRCVEIQSLSDHVLGRKPSAQRWRLALLAFATALSACGRPEPAPEPVRAVRTWVVASGSTGRTQEFAAEIRARTESRLGFRVAGKLVDRPVQLGDAVRKGQVLARLDPQDLRLVQQSAWAAMQAAQANAEQAEAELKRFRGLQEQGFVSAAELERRTSVATASAAQLAQARAQAEVQGRQTAHGTLVADAAGVITAIEAEPGAVVAAGTPVLRLAWDGPRDVVFAVPEDRVASVRALLGAPAALMVQLWGDNAKPLRATVREVSAAADPATRTFSVKAGLDSASPAAARLGQTAVVTVQQGESLPAIKLPLTAVMQQQGQTAVWLLDKNSMTVRVQPIQVAGADGNEAVVASGLTPGDVVITAGVHVLTPGLKVKFEGAPAAASGPAAAASAAAPQR